MATTPWYTSQDLVSAVQRKIAIPLNQRTFTSDDVLAFASEEMMLSQVPDILMYHQEYFVWSDNILMVPNQTRYPVPERAMGMKLRDVFYMDLNYDLFEMTRINPDDKSYWQRESSVTNLMEMYYLEGNDLVLAPMNLTSPTGWLRFSYFLRPNQLVDNSRAAIIQSFYTNLTVTAANITVGDTLQVARNLFFTAVAGTPGPLQFQIGGTDTLTATNLMNAINLDGTYKATVTNPNIVSLYYTNLSSIWFYSSSIAIPAVQTYLISSNPTGISVAFQIGMAMNDMVPANITSTTLVDFLQTKSGHRLYAKDVPIVSVFSTALVFDAFNFPLTMQVGDYVCEQYECIIPQIPTDLHSGLAERVCARILAAMGDMQGVQLSTSKIADIKNAEGILTENRVDGSTEKVNLRKSPLSFQRMGVRRRI